MKINKSLFAVIVSSFIFTSSCACISENEQNQNIPEHIAERLTRDKPPSNLLENINEAKKNQESTKMKRLMYQNHQELVIFFGIGATQRAEAVKMTG